jgi:hypothetical protein
MFPGIQGVMRQKHPSVEHILYITQCFVFASSLFSAGAKKSSIVFLHTKAGELL